MGGDQHEGDALAPLFRLPAGVVPVPGTTLSLQLRTRRTIQAISAAVGSGGPILVRPAPLRTLAALASIKHLSPGDGEAGADVVCTTRVKLLAGRHLEGVPTPYRSIPNPADEQLPPELHGLIESTTAALDKYLATTDRYGIWDRQSLLDEFDQAIANGYFADADKLAFFKALDLDERLTVAERLFTRATKKITRARRAHVRPRQRQIGIRRVSDQEDDRIEKLLARIATSGFNAETMQQVEKRLQAIGTTKEELLAVAESVPWEAAPARTLDLEQVRQRLDAVHEGAAVVKRELIRYLAVLARGQRLGRDTRAPALLLVGPPGVGKSGLAIAMAAAMGRPFVRIDLGGISEAHSLRGSHSLYMRAQPGMILQAIRQAGSRDAVVLLDELDKLGRGNYNGRAEDVLLPILDPDRNSEWRDAYLELPLNLSQVIFVATANDLRPISEPLKDRLQIIRIPGYTGEQRLRIARKHLVPRALNEMPVLEGEVVIPDSTLRFLVEELAQEKGVRRLRRLIEQLVSQAVVELTFYDRMQVGGLLEPGHKPRIVVEPDLAARWLS